jgi:ligand-binding sensor domain-containing protein
MNKTTGTFFNYAHNDADTNSLSSESVNCMAEDVHSFWIGTTNGLDRLDHKGKRFRHYFSDLYITSVCVDAAGAVWVGTTDSLYMYDTADDQFIPFTSPNSFEPIQAVLNIVEDDEKNLWISTTNAIIRINSRRDQVKIFGESYGVKQNTFNYGYNFKAANGELFFGDQSGYYAFFPGQLKSGDKPPRVNITGFRIRDKEVRFLANDSVTISQQKKYT